MSDVQLDKIVDEITKRVEARLCGSAAGGPAGSCTVTTGKAPNTADCDACRGCHVNRPEEVRELVQMGAARIAAGTGHAAPGVDLAKLIDHTLLKPDATREQLAKLCEEAKRYGFATVCVNASNVRFCAALLEGCSTRPIAVVGFPLGASTLNAKAYEAREAVRNGAAEIDMVINIGALKSKDYALVLDDIAAVVAVSAPKPVKVILETGGLEHDEKVIACALAKVAGAAFVKTSTGFGPGGATAEDVALMRAVVGPDMGVKASGGMRSEEDVRRMVRAGATRIGASASVAIVTGESQQARGPKLRVTALTDQGRRSAGGY